MGKRLKRLVSLCLAMVVVLNTMMVAYAQTNSERTAKKSNIETVVVEDETGRYTITVEETMLSRTTKLYDESGKLIQTLILDKETGVLSNPDTNVSIVMDSQRDVRPEMCRTTRSHEHEYEFCSLGEIDKSTESVTVAEIIEMAGLTVGASVATSKIVAVIAGLAGVSSLKGTALKTAKAIANKIKSEILGERFDTEVVMDFTFKCTEQWESDSSYTGGGFWFLGYLPSGIKYKLVR